MAHTQDYVPSRDGDFDGWLDNLVSYVQGKTGGTKPEWAHIPGEKVQELVEHKDKWHEAYVKCLGPHTSVDTEAKNNLRKLAEPFVRTFVQQFLKFDPVTNEDRLSMNLHNRDNTKTTIGVPTDRPVVGDVKAKGGFGVEITFSSEATPNSKARPYGCNGCLFFYVAGPEKVTDYDLLVKTKLMTHSPFVLQLEPEAEGKNLSFACRWQNETGELGPWSEIHHIVVS